MEEAAKPGGPLSAVGEAPLSVAQAFSLAHRADLMEDCTEANIEEMRHEVLDALNTVAGTVLSMSILQLRRSDIKQGFCCTSLCPCKLVAHYVSALS